MSTYATSERFDMHIDSRKSVPYRGWQIFHNVDGAKGMKWEGTNPLTGELITSRKYRTLQNKIVKANA